MGCIEIARKKSGSPASFSINRNMGCIEMSLICGLMCNTAVINRNMGCIEMLDDLTGETLTIGLIETWDVLKCYRKLRIRSYTTINRNMGCIEILYLSSTRRPLINRNMGCIEIIV